MAFRKLEDGEVSQGYESIVTKPINNNGKMQ